MNPWCIGCKAQNPMFDKCCDGLEADWNIVACEEAQKKAQEKYMNRWCRGCKARVPTFAKYCDGIEGDWTIRACEEARKKAREKYVQEMLDWRKRRQVKYDLG